MSLKTKASPDDKAAECIEETLDAWYHANPNWEKEGIPDFIDKHEETKEELEKTGVYEYRRPKEFGGGRRAERKKAAK